MSLDKKTELEKAGLCAKRVYKANVKSYLFHAQCVAEKVLPFSMKKQFFIIAKDIVEAHDIAKEFAKINSLDKPLITSLDCAGLCVSKKEIKNVDSQ